MKNGNKKYAIVFSIFALVIVTTAASFAFFNYSRVGDTTTTVTSGDIEFTYVEGDSASLANAFPVSDTVGARDTTGEYTFKVNLSSTSQSNKMNYNVYLLDNNSEANTNYFTNEQIKFALIKDGTFVAETTSDTGKKLTDIPGFIEDRSIGEGIVLENQEITSGKTDEYKLRIWISDDVNYSNTEETEDGTDTENDVQTSTGKFNGYKYSLKVKVTSEIKNSIKIENINVNKKTVTANLSDPNGLSAYAVTTNVIAPATDSDEWIEITDSTVKNNVKRISDSLITSKSITYTVSDNGIYYLHVKNKLNQIFKRSFNVLVREIKPLNGSAAEKIINLASTNTEELRVDTHEAIGQQDFDTVEYRYWGAEPNNYVWFNEELWRIIGIFDVDDGSLGKNKTGNIEKRIKMVRDKSIGKLTWDYSESNFKGGINEWSQSDLMFLLNSGAYYNRSIEKCYGFGNTELSDCDFTAIGLTDISKKMISDAKWYLGAIHMEYQNLPLENFYILERGYNTGKICTPPGEYSRCSDNVTRTHSWIGKVGLMYPSDYGYSIETPHPTLGYQYYPTYYKDTSWLYKSNIDTWLINSHMHNSYAYHVMYYNIYGGLDRTTASSQNGVRPVVYLNADVKIIDGIGSYKQPFILNESDYH